uniref:Appetite-regulating hormone n=1 Tax=Capra hircus TaxID=9925 RepID=A0A8C2PJL3_CAPHI
MPAPGTVCSLQLLSALWVDLARAGSSSLSLKHHEVPRKEGNLAEGCLLDPRPFSLPLLGAQVLHWDGGGRVRPLTIPGPSSYSSVPPLTPGSKLSGFLQDVLWEEALFFPTLASQA